MTSAQDKYLRPQRGSEELVWAVTGGESISSSAHLRTISEEIRDGKKDRDAAYESKLKVLVRYLKGTDKRLLLCAKSTGACLKVRGTTVSGTVLSDMTFWGVYVHVITFLA